MFSSVLIANRGEIACRVIRACRALGLRSVAIYSEADIGALHTTLADESLPVGPAPAAQSYLRIDRVIEAALEAKVGAVHPGYGFLSESAEFARRVSAAGLVWIGPRPETIEAMGDKQRARDIAAQCGVPVLPGSAKLGADDGQAWLAAAAQVGYPLLVKAANGGGGIGMRRVDRPEDLAATVASAQALALKAFGQSEVYLERFIERARHIEIQVFGFGDGQAVHLFERECSVQRRFQKVVEESPAPGVPPEVVARMAEAAVALARSQHYSGAGTVEFVLDALSHEFFFLEMNTRIQVEHAVTEMVTGWDLVQAQIRFAAGEFSGARQQDIVRRGAAIEVRVYAENPSRQFMPAPGRLSECSFPTPGPTLRVDCGVRSGDAITPYYDPMVAKLIAHGEQRDYAVATLDSALRQSRLQGIHHNLGFLRAVLQHPDFRDGRLDTGFVDRERVRLVAEAALLSNAAVSA
ncbi:MAG: ATP-grasp domain-containing protein [Burkholderiaceae bacterium]|nr:ATP-grasp domain-containing protein [Burkholderiaceae bacterium]